MDLWAAPTLHWLAGNPDKATSALLNQPAATTAGQHDDVEPSIGSLEPSVLQTLYLIAHIVPASLPPTPATKLMLAEVAGQASRQLEIAGLPLLALEALHLHLLLDSAQAEAGSQASDRAAGLEAAQSLTQIRAARLAALSALATVVHTLPSPSGAPAPTLGTALPAAEAHFSQLLSSGLQFDAAVASEALEHMLKALHPPLQHQLDEWQAEGADELPPLGTSPLGASPVGGTSLLSHHSFGTGRVQSRRTSETSSGMGLSIRRSVLNASVAACTSIHINCCHRSLLRVSLSGHDDFNSPGLDWQSSTFICPSLSQNALHASAKLLGELAASAHIMLHALGLHGQSAACAGQHS